MGNVSRRDPGGGAVSEPTERRSVGSAPQRKDHIQVGWPAGESAELVAHDDSILPCGRELHVREPKNAITCFASTTGEFDAKLPYCG